MLGFIVPLRSRQASHDWTLVSALARRTLSSVLAQTHQDFHVFLVCRDLPDTCPVHPRLTIVQRSFPVPSMSDRHALMKDKGRKVLAGLSAARTIAPCHLMLCDADDCVSNRLAAHAAARPASHGWYFDQGWMHDENSALVFKRRHEFDAYCGTSSMVRVTPDDLPAADEPEVYDENCVLLSGHGNIRTQSMVRGTPLEPLPFPGSIYILNTGENWSGFSLRGWRSKRVLVQKILNYRPVTRGLRSEFGLYPLANAS